MAPRRADLRSEKVRWQEGRPRTAFDQSVNISPAEWGEHLYHSVVLKIR